MGNRIRSFKFAFKGITTVFSTQPNASIHALATIVVVIAGFVYQISLTDWGLLVLAMSLVWVAEFINTAIEFLVDLTTPAYHELAQKTKDAAAGAVLIAAIFAVIIALIVFGKYFFH